MTTTPQNIFSKITASDVDAFKFLQGQVTANLQDLENDLDNYQKKYILSSYCNLKGRVISVFYISKDKTHNTYDLIFLGDTAEIFLSKIKKYSIFSKIVFSEIKSLNLLGLKELYSAVNNNILSNNHSENSVASDLIIYCIKNKIPIITAATSERFLPENIHLTSLNAVSFTKGCFLGQEIIARMHYLGKNKRHTYIIKYKEPLEIKDILSGVDVLSSNNEVIGELLLSYNDIGYIVIEERFVSNNQYTILNSEIELMQ